MVPQLYVTIYKEHFTSPGRVAREQLRPTSANRKNNPQPRQDFLFPRSLQSSHTPHRTPTHPSPLVDKSRPAFPPVKHISFQSPATTCADSKPITMPPVSPSRVQALPSPDTLLKPQLTDPPAGPGFHLHAAAKNPARMDHQRNVHTLSAQQLRQHALAQLRTRSQTIAPGNHFPRTEYRSAAKGILDNSGCYSCFHVVKSFQAGDYIIHPEFVSECLR